MGFILTKHFYNALFWIREQERNEWTCHTCSELGSAGSGNSQVQSKRATIQFLLLTTLIMQAKQHYSLIISIGKRTGSLIKNWLIIILKTVQLILTQTFRPAPRLGSGLLTIKVCSSRSLAEDRCSTSLHRVERMNPISFSEQIARSDLSVGMHKDGWSSLIASFMDAEVCSAGE